VYQLLLLAVVIAAAALWLSPELRERFRADLPRLLTYAGFGLLAVLVATGRLNWMLALAFAALGLAQRAAASRTSRRLETRFLRLRPGGADGTLDGEVKSGRFAGRRLSTLSLKELRALHGELETGDPPSLRLLEAYLDHIHGTAWRQGGAPAAGGNMSLEEAYAILGLRPGAEAGEIVEAHRRLMQRMHPDRGGSDYLAARINEAKRRLLGSRAAG